MTIKPKWDSKSAGEYERSLTLRDIKVEDDDDIQDYKKPWVGLTAADFDKLEQLFGNKVSNDFVFADIVCVISAKLKEKNT